MLSGQEGGLAPALSLVTSVLERKGWKMLRPLLRTDLRDEERGQALLPDLRAHTRFFYIQTSTKTTCDSLAIPENLFRFLKTYFLFLKAS